MKDKLLNMNRNLLGVILFVLLAGGFSALYLHFDNSKNSAAESVPRTGPATPVLNEKDPGESSVLLKIDGQEVSLVEIFGPDLMNYYNLQQQIYDFKMARVRRYITEHFIKVESARLKISPEEYKEKEIRRGKKFTPSNAEIEAFLRDQNVPDEQLNNEEIRTRASGFLAMAKELDIVQEKIKVWSQTHPIDIFFSMPSLNIPIPEDHSPVWGPKTAKITIVEFSDFQCPFCAKAAEMVKAVKKKYKNDVKFVYKHLPNPNHPQAQISAKSGYCVHEQNPAAFWVYYDLVFKNQANLATEIPNLVKKTGVDMKLFNECLQSSSADQVLSLDLQLAQQLGLRSTPTFFVNGKVIQGAMPTAQMFELIDQELAK